MNSKGIIAIIVVIILIVACVGVGVFFSNQNNNSSSSIEKVKTGVGIGDVIVQEHKDVTVKLVDNANDFFTKFYYTGDPIESAEKDIKILYNNEEKTYHCIGFQYNDEDYGDTIAYAVKDSGFILQRILTIEGKEATATLRETNIDVSLTPEDQIKAVKEDTFFRTLVTYNGSMHTEHVYGNVDTCTSDKFTVSVAFENNRGGIYLEVREIKDGMVYFTSKDKIEPMTVAQFRSILSLDDWNTFWGKEQKYEINFEDKGTITIDTPYGEHEVTRRVFTLTKPGADSLEFELLFNENGFIYSSKQVENKETRDFCIYTLMRTNMIA